jgi:hypothetical protein
MMFLVIMGSPSDRNGRRGHTAAERPALFRGGQFDCTSREPGGVEVFRVADRLVEQEGLQAVRGRLRMDDMNGGCRRLAPAQRLKAGNVSRGAILGHPPEAWPPETCSVERPELR